MLLHQLEYMKRYRGSFSTLYRSVLECKLNLLLKNNVCLQMELR